MMVVAAGKRFGIHAEAKWNGFFPLRDYECPEVISFDARTEDFDGNVDVSKCQSVHDIWMIDFR